MNLPLNIDWQQILLHLFNFVILFAILYFLLYQPVKQYMDKRTADYKKMDEDTKSNLAKSEKTKEEYDRLLASADAAIAARQERARKEIEENNAVRIEQAEREVKQMIATTEQALEREHEKMLSEAQYEISDMVITATKQLVLQSGTSESYEQFLAAVGRGGENEG